MARPPFPTGDRATPWERATRVLPLAGDSVVVTVVGVAALLDLALATTRFGPVLVLAGLGSVAMAALRRWAALPAIVVLAAGNVILAGLTARADATEFTPLLAPVVAVAALSSTAVRRLPAPLAVAAVAAGSLSLAPVLVWRVELLTHIFLAALLTGTWALGVGTGAYLRHLDAARVREAEEARRSERLDLARELHDLVAHYVTGIVVQAQAAQVVADHDPTAAGSALTRIEAAGRDALGAMRTMVGSLRADGAPGEAGPAPLAPPVALDDLAGLEALAERSRAVGLDVAVAVAPEVGVRARGAVAASAHRIVQEALTNVHRHAVEPRQVAVAVGIAPPPDGPDGAVLVVTVTDDGRHAPGALGARPLPGPGFGLVGMAERAHALGGALTAGPVDPPGQGWRVRAVIPLGSP